MKQVVKRQQISPGGMVPDMTSLSISKYIPSIKAMSRWVKQLCASPESKMHISEIKHRLSGRSERQMGKHSVAHKK